MLQIMFKLNAKQSAFFSAVAAICVAMAGVIRSTDGISTDEHAYVNMWAESINFVTVELGNIFQIDPESAARAMWETAYDLVEAKDDSNVRALLTSQIKARVERNHDLVANWCYITD